MFAKRRMAERGGQAMTDKVAELTPKRSGRIAESWRQKHTSVTGAGSGAR